jgi:hypothetical protein
LLALAHWSSEVPRRTRIGANKVAAQPAGATGIDVALIKKALPLLAGLAGRAKQKD